MNWQLLANSLLVALATMLLACGFGFIAALFAAGLSPRSRDLLFAAALAALALPPFLVVNCWLYLFGATGVWRSWLPLDVYSLGAAALILSLLTWPITLLAVWSAWQKLEAPQLESDLRLTGWALIRVLLLPLARSALVQAALLTFVLALNNFSVPSILQVKVFASEVWIRFSANSDALGALLLSWPLILAPIVLLLWMLRREIPWPRLEGTVSPRLLRTQLGRGWFHGCASFTALLIVISVGVPLLQLLSAPGTWHQFSIALIAERSAVWNSFFYALTAAGLGTGASLIVASFAPPGSSPCNRRPSLLSGLGWFLWLPFLVPGVFLGIALIVVFNRPWLTAMYQSVGLVLLALTLRFLAISWNTVVHGMAAADRDLIDAARLEGATRWQLLRHAYLPQIRSPVVLAFYVIFLLCLWDVETLVLVYPPGGETVPVLIFNLLHYGHHPQVNALCLVLLLLALAPLVVYHATARLARLPAIERLSRRMGALVLAALGGSFLVGGCSVDDRSGNTRLHSTLFSSVEVIGSRGAGLGQFLKPRSVVVDRRDNLYVVDMTGRVQEFASNGIFQLSWQMPQTDLGKAKGMARDRQGNIVVVEPHYQRVNHFTPAGNLVAQWGNKGTNVGQFTLPRAIAFNSRDEALVSEYGILDRVQRFAPARAAVLQVLGQTGSAPGEFNRPEGLCVDAQDHLYVADSCNHRIQVFGPDGRFLRAYGKPGQGRGELSYPYDICVDAAGRQYVCEFGNSRIQVFDSTDHPLEIIGGPGSIPGRFSNPWGLALDSAGNLYVADSQNHRVQKLVRRMGT